MAVKHRKPRQRAKKIATIGMATATVTALTVGAAPPPQANAAAVKRDVDLQAGVQLFPPPEAIPDLTGGMGTFGYNLTQQISAEVTRAIVENVNLAAVARAAGIDPQSLLDGLVDNALNQVLGLALGGVLGAVPIDLAGVLTTVLTEVLAPTLGSNAGPVAALLSPLIGQLLGIAGVDNLGALFSGLGLDLSNPLDLSGDPVPGLNIVTAGWPFALLKMLGPDLGWQPSFVNPVAEDINSTEYLNVGVSGLLDLLGIDLPVGGPNNGGLLGGLLGGLKDLLGPVLGGAVGDLLGPLLQVPGLDLDEVLKNLPDLVALRVPVVVGVGLGAFAAGMAYQQVVDDLPNQPGGANYTGVDPLLGSFTVLPMLLLDNLGRANGGILARAYPFFRLLGIDTVTPDTQAQHSGGIPLFNTGLSVGGANLIPIKIDATFEYLPTSDFAAWPNPFTLANNLAAGLLPTYILRGLSVGGLGSALTEQLTPQLLEALGNVTGGDPLALNFYLTLPAGSLPLLEPTYLVMDMINLMTGANFNNPIGTALSPVLTSLVNLGYTDVVYNSTTGVYERTFDQAHIPTAFGTLPDVNWAEVPLNLLNALAVGVQKAFNDGLINTDGPVPNALGAVLGLLGIGDLLPAGGSGLNLSGLDLSGVTEALNDITGITTANFEPKGITQTGSPSTKNKVLTLDAVNEADIPQAEPEAEAEPQAEAEGTPAAAEDQKRSAAGDDLGAQAENPVVKPNDRAKISAENARTQARKAVENAQARVGQRAGNSRAQIETTVKGVEQTVNDTADKLKQAVTPKTKVKVEKKTGNSEKKVEQQKDAA